MDIVQTLQNDLQQLESSLAQLSDVETQRASATDPPFQHFSFLVLSSRPTYSQVRQAFDKTFDPELQEKTKLGGDVGGRLLVLSVKKLLEVGELSDKARLHQALSWVARLQIEVNKLVHRAPSEEVEDDGSHKSHTEGEGSPPPPGLKRSHSPVIALPLGQAKATSSASQASAASSKRARKSFPGTKAPPASPPSSPFKPGHVVLAPFDDCQAWPSLVLEPSKVPLKDVKGAVSDSSVLVAWVPNIDDLTWRDSSKLSALTVDVAKQLLKTRSAGPKSKSDKKHFLDALRWFIDGKPMEEWKEEAMSVLAARRLAEIGVEVVDDEDVAQVQLVCCDRGWDGKENILACDRCDDWYHLACISYVCSACSKEGTK